MGYIKFPWQDSWYRPSKSQGSYEKKDYLRIHKNTAFMLDTIVFNIKNDWDFVILITGDRTVRVSKSVLGMTIAAYLAYSINKMGQKNNNDKLKSSFNVEDVYFDSKEMMEAAFKKEKYSINVYDEGREGLAASKRMRNVQQDLLDFFAESGQLNQIFIIILPDFFGLTEEIAVPRSEILFNVFRNQERREIDMYGDGIKRPIVEYLRGNFDFYNRKNKKLLHDIYKKTNRKNYHSIKHNFMGDFVDQYPFDPNLYKDRKRGALSRFKENKGQKEIDRIRKMGIGKLAAVAFHLTETQRELGRMTGLTQQRISQLKKDLRIEDDGGVKVKNDG
jgi:hypothetical protein